MLDNASTSESSSRESLPLCMQTFDADHWQSFGEASSKSEQDGPSRPLSVNCPNCKAPWIIPTEILEAKEDDARTRNTTSRGDLSVSSDLPLPPPLVARKLSESSQYRPRDPSPFSFEPAASLASFDRRRRRSSSIISDSSSQTKVAESLGPSVSGPILRSILSGASSVSSGKVTLAGKRSVKFSEEPVYYDYSYRQSCNCEQELRHSPYCKIPYDCDGECLFDCGYYDYDMFSFEQPDEIPSVKKWGVLSRIIAWIRRRRGKKVCADTEKGRVCISRPYALGSSQSRIVGVRGGVYGNGIVKRGRHPQRAVLRSRTRLHG
ncbi:hypothetical protein SCHPADRAFT_26872 [Schizopora paradoxa]|uniref:Uncharacterized protein n=1 Tax=Schizopora paradoxa TaxID=27342 RepID=A0A0H2S740_9AGAM|nr:hypothetical protein SCHPADRAFT_26872 [Schizopora paradoxa]